jgi:hypothetical protein
VSDVVLVHGSTQSVGGRGPRRAQHRIVVVDGRGGALPHEPSRLRPAVVVEDHGLFPDDYPTDSRITAVQLASIRKRITVAIGAA